eukprot:363137-Chlamydomonas_euryale.AAC.6
MPGPSLVTPTVTPLPVDLPIQMVMVASGVTMAPPAAAAALREGCFGGGGGHGGGRAANARLYLLGRRSSAPAWCPVSSARRR